MNTSIDGNGSLGFRVWRGLPGLMERAHLHCDVEINFLLDGEIEYFFGGHFQVLKPDEPTLFWAGMPHVITRVMPQTQMIWGSIPLAWFLQWNLPASFVEALLRGQVLALRENGELHRALLIRWCEEFGVEAKSRDQAEKRKIIALEVEALLRRIALGAATITKPERASTSAGGKQVDRLAGFIARHYRQELTIQEIARAVDLHPNYAMQLFKEKCGLSLWDYVLRLRVSHAQYLLLTTQRKMSDIAQESGFASDSRFYAAFEKYSACAPRAWREQMTGIRPSVTSA